MNFITGLHPEPEFPRRDIDPYNARMAAVLLSNPNMLQVFHDTAEAVWPPFGYSHPCVLEAVGTVCNNQRARVANVGAAVYEALHALVQPTPEVSSSSALVTAMSFAKQSVEAIEADLLAANEAFYSQLPNATEVITEAAYPLVDSDTSYAVLGAAVSRWLELIN